LGLATSIPAAASPDTMKERETSTPTGRPRWRRRLAAAAMAVAGAAALYAAAVFGYAYAVTPSIVAGIEASGRLTLDPEAFCERRLAALVAVEDPGFYGHHGVDLTTPGSGWTTMTQGIAKIYYFDGFRPGVLKEGKLRQTLYALAIDARVDKRTQLRIFVNSAYFGTHEGRDVIGFEDAARTYFGKRFGELGDDEYLALIAMLVGPNDYSVAAQPERNRQRVARIKRVLDGSCRPAGYSDVTYEGCDAAGNGREVGVKQRLEAIAAGGQATVDFEVVYDDVHGLWGGVRLRLDGAGTVERIERDRTGTETRAAARVGADRIAELARLLVEIEAWAQREPERPPVPDESRARLSIRFGDERVEIWEWYNDLDRNQRIARVRDLLASIVKT
jgi:hypothetical protein